jgi:hypothetical protein
LEDIRQLKKLKLTNLSCDHAFTRSHCKKPRFQVDEDTPMTQESTTAHWYPNEAFRPIGHQPKSPIECGEPQEIRRRWLGAANDNRLAWPFIPFPENVLM